MVDRLPTFDKEGLDRIVEKGEQFIRHGRPSRSSG